MNERERLFSLMESYELTRNEKMRELLMASILHAFTLWQAAVGMIPLLPEEIDFLRQGKKIFAIKSLRQRTNMSLKEAKEFVEEWLKNNP